MARISAFLIALKQIYNFVFNKQKAPFVAIENGAFGITCICGVLMFWGACAYSILTQDVIKDALIYPVWEKPEDYFYHIREYFSLHECMQRNKNLSLEEYTFLPNALPLQKHIHITDNPSLQVTKDIGARFETKDSIIISKPMCDIFLENFWSQDANIKEGPALTYKALTDVSMLPNSIVSHSFSNMYYKTCHVQAKFISITLQDVPVKLRNGFGSVNVEHYHHIAPYVKYWFSSDRFAFSFMQKNTVFINNFTLVGQGRMQGCVGLRSLLDLDCYVTSHSLEDILYNCRCTGLKTGFYRVDFANITHFKGLPTWNTCFAVDGHLPDVAVVYYSLKGEVVYYLVQPTGGKLFCFCIKNIYFLNAYNMPAFVDYGPLREFINIHFKR